MLDPWGIGIVGEGGRREEGVGRYLGAWKEKQGEESSEFFGGEDTS